MAASYDRLLKKAAVLEAALDLQADPDNTLKKSRLAALLAEYEGTFGGAIAKALRASGPGKRLPLPTADHVVKGIGAAHDITDRVRVRKSINAKK